LIISVIEGLAVPYRANTKYTTHISAVPKTTETLVYEILDTSISVMKGLWLSADTKLIFRVS